MMRMANAGKWLKQIPALSGARTGIRGIRKGNIDSKSVNVKALQQQQVYSLSSSSSASSSSSFCSMEVITTTTSRTLTASGSSSLIPRGSALGGLMLVTGVLLTLTSSIAAISPPVCSNAEETDTAEDQVVPHDGGVISRVGVLNRHVKMAVSATYEANDPSEDRHHVREIESGDVIATVIDGHGGGQCSEFAWKRLSRTLAKELKNAGSNYLAQIGDKGVFDCLSRTFLRVEREFLYQVKSAFDVGFGDVARAGACAVMTLVREDKVYVANAGDCRVVLGREGQSKGKLEAVALTKDHNAREEAEQEKLRMLHPDEQDIVRCKKPTACYVKGRLQPTRSLGDAYLKYSEFNGSPGSPRSTGRYLPPPYTPPYISADPEVMVHEIDAGKDQFIIMASDGLWDFVSNSEAVSIVQKEVQRGAPEAAPTALIEAVLAKAASHHRLSLSQMVSLSRGKTRRSKHDDVTCVVMFLGKDAQIQESAGAVAEE